MPDDDRFPRYLSPAWRKAPHCLEGHDPAERVGDVVTKAVAATIGAIHGIPSLPSLLRRQARIAPAQLTRLYGAYVREWEAVDLTSYRLSGDRSAALCETKS